MGHKHLGPHTLKMPPDTCIIFAQSKYFFRHVEVIVFILPCLYVCLHTTRRHYNHNHLLIHNKIPQQSMISKRMQSKFMKNKTHMLPTKHQHTSHVHSCICCNLLGMTLEERQQYAIIMPLPTYDTLGCLVL